ncbi:MAG: hypothetical protein IPJ65_22360 [Archangiaceae bacterium]|nr:hypothetical protein [Archangiaceae bacterium]
MKPTKPQPQPKLTLDLDKLRELTPAEAGQVVGAGAVTGAKCTMSNNGTVTH